MALQCPLFPWLQKEKLSAQASLKRHTSLNDLSVTRDEQEIEFLRLQVLEQQHVIDDLSLVCLRERERQPSVGRMRPRPREWQQGCRAMLLAGWDLTELLLMVGTFPLCSSRKQPPLVYTTSLVSGSGFHGYSFSQILSLVCCH